MNPYETLGISTDASKLDIKKAFRSLAQKFHPDRKGGDSSRFQEINAAYEILSDDERRKHFDETGSTAQGPSINDQAISALATLFDHVISKNEFYGDIVEYCIDQLSDNISEMKSNLEKLSKNIGRLEKLAGRIKSKSENLFQIVLDGKIDRAKSQAERIEADLLVVNAALALIEGYEDLSPVKKPEVRHPEFGHGLMGQLYGTGVGGFRP